MREIVRFSGGMHLANIIGGVPQLVLPLIVFARVGAQDAAFWGVAMSVASFLFQLPGLVIRALLPEASFRPAERRNLFRRSALLVPAIVLPALALAFFLSPIGLAIFGHTYATGALGPLRWLIVAALVSMPLSVLGAILVVAKKSLMTTVANAVDAVVVLGLVELWANNVDEIAVSWTVGELGNIVLFSIFAILALREVDWRWENLGGSQAESAVAPQWRDLAAARQLQGLDRLTAIAEQQRAGGEYDMWLRRHYSLNDSRSLFTVAALRAAEQRRAQTMRQPAPAHYDAPPGPGAPPRSARSDVAHQQAFDVLFNMAERQRSAEWHDPDYLQPPRGDYPYE
jgi:hypothetical protein